MAIKRPFCNYSGDLKELATEDTIPGISGAPSYHFWKINSDEVVSVGARQEYLIANGTLMNQGIISLASESILIVRA